MPASIRVSEEVKREAEKTVKALKNIGKKQGSSVDELRDRFLD
ncbi:MAG: hypothetical protein ABEJ36_01145 [Candidatus Nanosalina sp.]